MDVLWQRLDFGFRSATPALSALFMTLLGVSAWPIPYLGQVMPPLAFISLFYWSAHRPDLFPPSVAFFVGLLNDIVSGGILGLSALLFTLANRFIWQHRGLFAGHSFFLLWAGFSLSTGIFFVVQWSLLSLFNFQIQPFFPALVQAVLAIILFPLPCWVLILIQRSIVSPN